MRGKPKTIPINPVGMNYFYQKFALFLKINTIQKNIYFVLIIMTLEQVDTPQKIDNPQLQQMAQGN